MVPEGAAEELASERGRRDKSSVTMGNSWGWGGRFLWLPIEKGTVLGGDAGAWESVF